MSSVITASTAALIAAGVGAAGVGASLYEGNKASGQQAQALKQQNTAQQTATAASLSTERKSEVAQGQANQATPDLAGILQRAATAGKGLSSTMLTGPGGVNSSSLSLGKATPLGS